MSGIFEGDVPRFQKKSFLGKWEEGDKLLAEVILLKDVQAQENYLYFIYLSWRSASGKIYATTDDGELEFGHGNLLWPEHLPKGEVFTLERNNDHSGAFDKLYDAMNNKGYVMVYDGDIFYDIGGDEVRGVPYGIGKDPKKAMYCYDRDRGFVLNDRRE